MEENIKITNDIIKAVYAHISKRYNIDRDVANAVSDCQKVLKLMKSKCS